MISQQCVILNSTYLTPAIFEILDGDIKPLKTRNVCFIWGLSAYRAVNTLHLGCTKASINVV